MTEKEHKPIWLQKATKYIPETHESKLEGAWVENKVDGQAIQSVFNNDVRIYANGIAKKSGVFSDYTDAVPHIVKELEGLKCKGILQGEVYADHLSTGLLNFNYAVGVLKAKDSYVRQCKNGLLKYIIYDMPTHTGPYKERYDALSDLFKRSPAMKYVSLIPILDINYNGGWVDVFNKIVAQGGEGVVLYDQENLYKHNPGHNGRNAGIWKIKAQDAIEVKAYKKIEGADGKFNGSLGSLMCVDGKGKEFKIGSFAVTDEERLDIWDNVEVPFICEMTYSLETPDAYRHAILTRLRPDKDVNSWNAMDV
jgi:ATP-dependent DNA ligase